VRRRVAPAAVAIVAIAGVAGIVLWLGGPSPEAAVPAAARAVFSIHGAVTGTSGRPLAGARVELFAIDETHMFTPLGHALARPDGGYALGFAPPAGDAGLLIVRASATDCASESRTIEVGEVGVGGGARGGGSAQDFRLAEQAASVVVHVEDPGGKPHATACVLLTFEPLAAASDALYAWRLTSHTSGAVTFDGLPVIAGTLHVFAEHDRARVFVEHAKPAGAVRTELTVRLAGGRTVPGRLVAAGAAGDFAGAEVVVREADGPWLARIATRSDGGFEVPGAPVDTPLVAEVTGDWILAGDVVARPWRVPRGDEAFTLTLDVVPGGSIDGVVLDAAGTPLRGASVTIAAPEAFAGGARRVVTDTAGRFVVKGLPIAPAWAVEARYPGRAPARRTPVAARTRGLELRVATGGALVGRVVDRAGRGVPDIEVYAHAMQHGQGGLGTALPEYLAIRTDADGRYRLGQLNPGHYRFEVRPGARMQWSATASTVTELDVIEGETHVPDVTVRRGASLRGTGAPPGGETLELGLLPADHGGAPHRVVVQPTPDGAFSVDALEAGTYRLAARSASRGYSEVVEVTLVENATTAAALRFAGTAQLDGRVQTPGGAPPHDARIDVYRGARYDRAPDDWTGNWAAAGDDGRFSIAGLSAGRWTIKITSGDAAPLIRTVELADGTTHEGFVVDSGAALDVALLSAASPVAGTVVMLEAKDRLGVRASAIADAAGHARFDRLPRGSYAVRAVARGMPGATIDIADRAPRRVELRM